MYLCVVSTVLFYYYYFQQIGKKKITQLLTVIWYLTYISPSARVTNCTFCQWGSEQQELQRLMQGEPKASPPTFHPG